MGWSVLSQPETVINGDASVPTLKGLANDGKTLGNSVVTKNRFAVFELLARGAAAFPAGAFVELYLIQAFDDAVFQDGDDTTDPPASALANVFPLRAVASQQRVALPPVMLPGTVVKPLLINKSGQAFSSVDNENLLRMRTMNEV